MIIKFRAWYIKEKKMFGILRIGLNPTPCYVILDENMGRGLLFDEFILMQFIDLLDQKQKEIYDKDIIKTGYLEDKGYLIGVVEYQKRSARWGIRVGHRLIEFGKRGRWYEVIGNTYENPKLLKEV